VRKAGSWPRDSCICNALCGALGVKSPYRRVWKRTTTGVVEQMMAELRQIREQTPSWGPEGGRPTVCRAPDDWGRFSPYGWCCCRIAGVDRRRPNSRHHVSEYRSQMSPTVQEAARRTSILSSTRPSHSQAGPVAGFRSDFPPAQILSSEKLHPLWGCGYADRKRLDSN
jgi:hypothetical protein